MKHCAEKRRIVSCIVAKHLSKVLLFVHYKITTCKDTLCQRLFGQLLTKLQP